MSDEFEFVEIYADWTATFSCDNCGATFEVGDAGTVCSPRDVIADLAATQVPEDWECEHCGEAVDEAVESALSQFEELGEQSQVAVVTALMHRASLDHNRYTLQEIAGHRMDSDTRYAWLSLLNGCYNAGYEPMVTKATNDAAVTAALAATPPAPTA